MKEQFENITAPECLDKDQELRNFVNEHILPFANKEKLKSVIMYGNYLRNPQKAQDIDILIIYEGDKKDLQHLNKYKGKFDTTVFNLNWVKNNIIGRRDLSDYRVLYGQDLFKELTWEKYEKNKIFRGA